MSVYLKQFSTTAEYDAYIASEDKVLPNVSICEDTKDVHYNPFDPYAGHDYVEIGGLKWATMNIGANSITDTGLYFQWGDTQGYTASQVGSGSGQKYFGWADYGYNNDGDSPEAENMTRYNSTDGKTVLDLSDDAVRAAWGGEWRMPTTDEFLALRDVVNSAWTYNYQGSSVNGVVLTDKTDSSKVLFFPAVGYCINGSVNNVNTDGFYWSGSLQPGDALSSRYFHCYYGDVSWQSHGVRRFGSAVRGVVG